MEKCCICEVFLEDDNHDTAALGQKGVAGINKASGGKIQANIGNRVHVLCRRNLTRDAYNCERDSVDNTNGNEPPSILRRSVQPKFVSGEHCFFCGVPAKNDGKKRGWDVIPVRTKDFQDSIARACNQRNDEWAEKVRGRLEYAQDLHAADAVYHDQCSINFRTGKQVPYQYANLVENSQGEPSKRIRQAGRPTDKSKEAAFLQVATYLEENDDEQITVNDLCCKMGEYLEGTGELAYSCRYMKTKLLDHFKDSIIITSIRGKVNVVTFQRTVKNIINDFYRAPKNSDYEQEKKRIVLAAAELIKSNIKNIEPSSESYYPTTDEMSPEHALEFVPCLLQHFLRSILAGKNIDLRLACIAQAIIQGARPRAILCPLQLGLGVQMHHHFGSKFLIDSLNSHGFCSSYSTIQSFERSAAASQGTDITGFTADRFVQFSADNVDHNIRTLDGKGTFHGMGIIAAVTPGIVSVKAVPRKAVTKEDIANAGKIPIRYYTGVSDQSSLLQFNELTDLKVKDASANLDLLLKLTQPLLKEPQPSWSGSMQLVCSGDYPGKSTVVFLPMIDMDPGDLTCIYSTLSFIAEQASRYSVTPIVTFDQPLWWKATLIVTNEPLESKVRSVVLRLGGLHTEMSFLGSIGHLMAGSGLEDILELIYAQNAVSHMLSGKAIARAIRGHFLVDAALHTLLIRDTFNIPLPESMRSSEQNEEAVDESEAHASMDDDLSQAKELYDRLMKDPKSVIDEVCEAEVIDRLSLKLTERMDALRNQRTSALWLQYMTMIDILRRFIRAERTGDWQLHMQATHDMLPYFAAAGHNLYAKSAYMYLQKMNELEREHPDVFRAFSDGLHVVRRSDRYWAGLSTDLIIEQVLMRSIKTTGGLTRGRGMTETQRLVWLLSMPACADMNDAMQILTGINYQTSEQHKDVTKARKERDFKDTQMISAYLIERNPFAADPSLRSIVNGVVAEDNVNAERAKEVGDAILATMKGKKVLEFSFRRKEQSITLASKTAVAFPEGAVQVDPQLLFQRLSVVATGGRFENSQDMFRFEMCSYPPALFDSTLLPKQPDKSVLADALWSQSKGKGTDLPTAGNVQYVLDGGALLHRIPWTNGMTFDGIFALYVQYVKRKYGQAIIVFDGYEEGPTTKDCTHLRRSTACGPTVKFTPTMLLKSKKGEFLTNPENKQKFINTLSERLHEAGCTTLHASGDADLLIVQMAVKSAMSSRTVLVGDDTDLIVLLIHHSMSTPMAHDVYFAPEPKQSSTRQRRIWNMKETVAALDPRICKHILFLHAILGCDTTSRVHGIGKGVALKKIRMVLSFLQQAEVFLSGESTKVDIIDAGEKALVCLYKGSTNETLDIMRYTRYCQKVASGSICLQPESLPPTRAAAAYHSLRTFYQVQQWKGDCVLLPEDWGWERSNGKLLPVRTDLPPAHISLLEMVRCKCKSDCSTRRCTCKKNGLECSAACGECKGQTCSNSGLIDLDASVQDEE